MPKCRALALAALVVLSLASCATVRSRVSGDPLAVLGTCAALGASGEPGLHDALYVVIPVRGNEELVAIAASRLSGKPGDARLAKRLDALYVAVTASGPAARRARFVATGSIPKSGASLFLTERKGWTRCAEAGYSWYRSGPLSVAIPSSGVACGLVDRSPRGSDAGAAMVPFLRAFAARERASPPVSRSFADYAGRALADGRIGFFASDPAPFMAALLGPEVTLPVKTVEGYATANGEGDYVLSLSFTLSDRRSARALKGLLARVFAGSTVLEDEERVGVSGFVIAGEKLAQTIDFLYLVTE